ncbi:MAG: hypothetical protein EOP51_18435, partial [Sphingobacteriales bacterium]
MKKLINRSGILAIVTSFFAVMDSQAQQPATLPVVYPAGTPVNYVRSWDAIRPETNPANITTASQPVDHRMTTQYVDGLGRPLQTVVKQGAMNTNGGTPVTGDLVSPVVYDEYGREVLKYLPFAAAGTDGMFKTNPFQQQAVFYNGQLSGQAGETYVGVNGLNWAYSQSLLETSPLGRPLENFAPGSSWVGTASQSIESARKSVKMKYCLNTSTDQVVIWEANVPSGFYSAGELYKTITVDEHGKQVIEFKDKLGNVILKKVQVTGTADAGTGAGYTGWLSTYYIYDAWNKLIYVIQPQGVQRLYENSWPTPSASATLWATIMEEQTFQYTYDDRSRMITKKVPGAGSVYMVYDARDRLVLTQDANQRNNNKWLFTKYDELNRPVMSGIYTNNIYTTRPAMQGYLNTQGLGFFESVASSGFPYTLNQSFPVITDARDVYIITHYDNYDRVPAALSASFNTMWNNHFYSAINTAPLYPQPLEQSFRTNGLVTWTQTKVLETDNTYLSAVYIFDEKARIIQQTQTNILGEVSMTTTQYNWSGQPLKVAEGLRIPNVELAMLTRMTYDEMQRLIMVEKNGAYLGVNGDAYQDEYTVLFTQEYDALGQLNKKKIGSKKDPSTGAYYTARQPVQQLAYDYNIRGWLLGANREYLATEGQTGDGTLFGFELAYDKLVSKAGLNYGSAQLNGNINGITWKSDGDDKRRKLLFARKYKQFNRLAAQQLQDTLPTSHEAIPAEKRAVDPWTRDLPSAAPDMNLLPFAPTFETIVLSRALTQFKRIDPSVAIEIWTENERYPCDVFCEGDYMTAFLLQKNNRFKPPTKLALDGTPAASRYKVQSNVHN